jgi:putative transcriptional regulator
MTKSLGDQLVNRMKDFAESLETAEAIPDRFTRHKVRLDLTPRVHDGTTVKETRELLGASQAIFAKFIGVSVSTVQDWEQERKQPREIACRLLDEIRRDPEYWIARLKELLVAVDEPVGSDSAGKI